jgi:hypothetical protein
MHFICLWLSSVSLIILDVSLSSYLSICWSPFLLLLKKMLHTESSLVLLAWKKAISFKHHWTCRIALHWRGECLQKVICHTIWGAWLQVLLSQHFVKRMENWLLTCHAWCVYSSF